METTTQTGPASAGRDATPDADALEPPPLDIARIVVPIGGSPIGERGLAPAIWIAHRLGAALELVEVVAPGSDSAAHAARLEHLIAGRPRSSVVVLEGDPIDELTSRIGFGDRVIACVATHGRDRGTGLLRSTATALLDAVDRPMLLVGPRATPPRLGPVVAAVDGHAGDAEVLANAVAWARALGRGVLLATVAEPAPPDADGVHVHRARGPEDPDRHLADLWVLHAGHGVDASAEIVYDPVSMRDGLVPLLERIQPSLVVVGSRHRHGIRRAVLGDHAAEVVHDAPAPVLVVPLGLRA